MARLRFDAVKGALNAALDTPTTMISSPGLARLGNVASPNTALICLYSTDADGNIVFSENVYVISHAAGAVTATITRAGDGTSARSWPIGTNWTHGLGVADVVDIEANSTNSVTTFNTRSGTVTLTKADVTSTGLTYSDVGADASGAAALALPKAGGTMTGPITGFQDKGGQVFNVKAYGATGDGTTDDTAAIVAAAVAANAVGGGCVYFPQGTYAVKIQSTIMRANRYYAIPVYPNVRFVGASKTASIIKLVGLVDGVGTSPWSVFGYKTTDSGGAELQDITVDMNSAAMALPSVSPNLTMEISQATTPISIENVWVKNVDSVNTFYLITSNRCSINQLTISCVAKTGDIYHDYSAIYWTGKNTTTSSLQITNSVCQAASIPVAGATTFIEVHGPNVAIANNTSQNMQTFANLTGITGTANASQTRNISVVGNVAKGAQYGCIVWSESSSGSYVTTPLANVEIVGNTFDLDPAAWSTSASAAPVGCATGVLMDTGETQNGVQNLTINSNIINYASSYGATDSSGLGSGIRLSQGTVLPTNPNFNWTIQNNTINNPQACGINTGNTFVTGLTITGNTIRNCGQNTTISTLPYRSGILVSSDGVNFVVSNNNIYDDQDSPTMTYGISYQPQSSSGHDISNSTCINNNISTASYSQTFVPIYCDSSSNNSRYPLIQHNAKYGWLPVGFAQVNSIITDSVLGLTYRQTAQPKGSTWQADALPLSATSPNLAALADALPSSIASWVAAANTTNALDSTVAPLVSGSTWVKTSGTGVASGVGPTVTGYIPVTAGQTYSASAWGLLPTDNIFTGTASATSSTTLTVSTATFTTNSLIGSTVTATSMGTTTTGVVTANTNTTLTVSGWSNGTPDATSPFSFTFGSNVYFYVAISWYSPTTLISSISAHSAGFLKLGVPTNSISVSDVAPATATRARVSVHLGGTGLAANGGYFWTSAIAFCNDDTANFTIPGTPTLSNSASLPAQLSGATLTSPNLVLSPTAPTQTAGDSSTLIATTAFVGGVKGLPIGLTGATDATRYVGGTTSGAPTSGTFAVGDFVVDRSAAIWICTAAGTPGTWSTISGSGGGSTTVTAADASIVVGGTTSAPTIATGTLDVVATQHPPAAAVAMNAKKITGLANGTVNTDAAALGQIPVGTSSVNQGLKAATFMDMALANATVTLTAGVQYFFQVNVPYTFTASNFLFRTVAAASSLSHGLLGLYTQAGSLISGLSTTDQTTFNAVTVYTLPLGTPQSLTPGTYYVGVLFSGTTPPSLIGNASNGSLIGPTVSAGTLAGNGRAMTSGSGLTALLTSISGTPALVNGIAGIGIT